MGLEPSLSDVVDSPSVLKEGADFGLGDPSRPLAGFLFTEAQQELGPSRNENRGKAFAKADPRLIGEHMEKPGINQGVEGLSQARQLERIDHTKIHPDTALD